ncbi:MAG: hypothetical protein H6700_05580 [Myxococcales bacterium]|nr:hypothetical protein [Myxococcales bacterium]MCB9520162.1 hypothetical protein [Myxococcales bacterium]MCB9531216.1 hypothetical protein [Myxococcales bacterium]
MHRQPVRIAGAQPALFARSLMLRAALAAAAGLGGCGDDDNTLDASAAKVVRQCSSHVFSRQPFGQEVAVNRYDLRFRIPAGAQGFSIVAYTPGASTTLASLVDPAGFPHDLVTDEDLLRYHPAGLATAFGFPVEADQILIPPAPSQAFLLQSGEWELRADTGGRKVCVSIAVTETRGTRLELNVIAVGLEGMDAAALATNPDWNEALEVAAAIWARADVDIALDTIRYTDIDRTVAGRFAIISDWNDFADLVSTSEAPSSAAEDALRVNVFVNRGFAGSVGQYGLLGISMGAPGAIGVHGTEASGLVFGIADYLGVDSIPSPSDGEFTGAELIGFTLAHELGHFLGLLHTTERSGESDGLDDTPGCPGISALGPRGLTTCGDADNLMFPVVLPDSAGEISPMQRESVAPNPLLRPETLTP